MCCSGAVGKAAEPPKWIKPQLTCLVEEAPAGQHSVHEIEYDAPPHVHLTRLLGVRMRAPQALISTPRRLSAGGTPWPRHHRHKGAACDINVQLIWVANYSPSVRQQ